MLKNNFFSLTICWSSALLISCVVSNAYSSDPNGNRASNFLNHSYPIEVENFPGKECNRKCVVGEDPKICYFKFTLEHYHAMGPACRKCKEGVEEDCYHPQCIVADGIERGVVSINRQIPGPPIHVCKNDLLVIDVVNNMAGEASTLHWHGLHQRITPYMDGVPFITQCPIDFSTTFRYAFPATEPGTHFYHSHSGHQKVNGHYGALIVREPVEEDLNSNLYNDDLPEHVILMSDWMHETGEMFFPGLPSRGYGIQPDSLLINGRGQYIRSRLSERTNVPFTKYFVEPNRKYRFRVINSGSHICPFQLQVERHQLTVISLDSYPVEPRPFDTLISTSGERYDFVIETNQPIDDYFIRVRAIGSCVDRPIETFAILSYRRKSPPEEPTRREPPTYVETYPSGIYLNHPNASCFERSDDHCITELKALSTDEVLRYSLPDHRFFLGFDNYMIPNNLLFRDNVYNTFMNVHGNLTLVGAVNKLSLVFPSFPLLTQRDEINEEQFCTEERHARNCSDGEICPCLHVIKISLNSVVELVIVDETRTIRDLNHPFHLHGFKFMVTDMGQNPFGSPMTVKIAKRLDRLRALHATPFNPKAPFKDTISIPSRGYATVRFRADNPGFWLLHCHYDWHIATGMGLVLQVGDSEDMVSTPKGFPKCGNYMTDIGELLQRRRDSFRS